MASPSSARRFNRELSWLDFEQRVLAVAADPGVPLLERVKLCAIVSSNLDAFFAVRVAGLRAQMEPAVTASPLDEAPPEATLAEIRSRVTTLQEAQDALWLDELRPSLAHEGIHIIEVADCKRRELQSLAKFFREETEPLLTPIAVGISALFPLVPSLALNVGAIVRDPAGDQLRFVYVNVPTDLPRFIEVGASGGRVAIEDAILHFLPRILVGDIVHRAVFRVTRDAHFSVSRDAEDLLEAVQVQLLRRRFGNVVRLEVSHEAPAAIVDVLMRQLRIDVGSTYARRAPVGLGSLRELLDIPRPDLKDKPWEPITRRPFVKRSAADLFRHVERHDVLVHHPYDSFDSSVAAFAKAARDPKVVAYKATVYRTEERSPTLSSLVKTAEEGKHAVCLVELRARFDESRNIEWSRALERAGVSVIHGVPELKVHAKLALLVRRERGGLRRYVHIGTGNYHSSNASNYEDLGFFTADHEIAADVADVFNAITGLSEPKAFRKLLVGPWFLRDGILREIDHVARAAGAGEAARIRIKVNALVDQEVIEALYAASAAGATIQIVTRDICCLRPGVPGMSDRIAVRSVLGRFLEHSRVLSFQIGDRESLWIGSADLMPRNLDRRVEVMAPVEDSRLRKEIGTALDALLADSRFSWTLHADGSWNRTAPADGQESVSAQESLMARATKRGKKARSRR